MLASHNVQVLNFETLHQQLERFFVGKDGAVSADKKKKKNRFKKEKKKRSCATQEGGITSAAITPLPPSPLLSAVTSPRPPPAYHPHPHRAKNSRSHHPAHHVRACVRSHLLPTPTSFLFSSPLPSHPPQPRCCDALTSRRQVIAAGCRGRTPSFFFFFPFLLLRRHTSEIFTQV